MMREHGPDFYGSAIKAEKRSHASRECLMQAIDNQISVGFIVMVIDKVETWI